MRKDTSYWLQITSGKGPFSMILESKEKLKAEELEQECWQIHQNLERGNFACMY